MNPHPKFKTNVPGQHVVRGIPFKAHKIDGFTPEILEQHFEQVYGGAVRRLNQIEILIADGDKDPALIGEQLSVANAIILHELHFSSLGEDGGEDLSDSTLKQAFEASFGSVAEWQAGFSAMATSLTNGWAVLAWSRRLGRLINLRIIDDDQGLFDAVPVLVMDAGEHAFSNDFGSDQKAYVTAFLQSIHWTRIAEKFHQAVGAVPVDDAADPNQISVAELKHSIDQDEDVLVLDVRHDDDCDRYRSRIEGTEWRDSFDVAGWVKKLPKNKRVVVYCMYGFWVSQKAAEELREFGIDARSLSGGVTAWRAMGYPSSSYAR